MDGFASNVGLLTYETMENDFSADIVLFQLPDGSVAPARLEQPFETGETYLPLSLEEAILREPIFP